MRQRTAFLPRSASSLLAAGSALALLAATPTFAQPGASSAAGTPAAPPLIACTSVAGERQHCAADTSSGVSLRNSTGVCELGRTWGYDETGLWVAEGCSGEFATGTVKERRFDAYTPTAGFKVVDAERGDLNIRVFSYVQYLNQSEIDPSYTNAFGQTLPVQQRQDFQLNKAQSCSPLESASNSIHLCSWSRLTSNEDIRDAWTARCGSNVILTTVARPGGYSHSRTPDRFAASRNTPSLQPNIRPRRCASSKYVAS